MAWTCQFLCGGLLWASPGCRSATAPAPAETAAPTQPLPGSTALADIAWLAGTWRGSEQDITVEETWTAPGGSTMLGLNRTIRGESTVAFEWLRIEARNGSIVYVAHPGGRMPGTEFTSTEGSPDAVVFENPDHDFPRRIEYRRASPNELLIDVTGEGPALHFALARVL